MSAIPEIEAGSRLTIDLSALAHNWKLLAARAAPGECAGVVKANAYGIGIEKAVPALLAAGCKTFFVAHLSEAKRVRTVAPEAEIFVLNGLLPGTAQIYAAHNLVPTLGSPEEIVEWRDFVARSGWKGGAALHVDTGLNRLGLRVGEALQLKQDGKLDGFHISLLLSHFVSSEEPENPLNQRQIDAVSHLMNQIQAERASLCNSSGFFLKNPPFHNLSRPGFALYGGNPTPGKPNPMRHVVSLDSRVLQLRDVPPGETAGYNEKWTARRPTRIATICLGYADGITRQLSTTDARQGGYAVVASCRCPFVARISMDLITIDVTDMPASAIKRGDYVQILGDQISVDDMAAWGNTNGYEILTSLGSRYSRRYVEAKMAGI